MPHSNPSTRTVQIQVADLESDPLEEVFPISILDGIMRKIANPITLTYSLDEAADVDTIVSNTCTGLQRLMQEYRFLAGSVHEDSQGRSYSKRAASQTHFTVHIKDLRRTAYPSYAELAARHFPVSELENADLLPPTFTPFPELPADGSGIRATMVQLNLIRGGLVIGLVVNHRLVDARGMDNVLARWAAHTRPLFDRAAAAAPAFDPAWLDRSPLMVDPTAAAATPSVDHRVPAVPSMRCIPDEMPVGAGVEPEQVASQIWHVPASKLKALKALASSASSASSTADGDGDGDGDAADWVSTNDCLTALMWRCITRSRLALHGIAPESVAADHRPVALMNAIDVRAHIPTLPSAGAAADPRSSPASSTASGSGSDSEPGLRTTPTPEIGLPDAYPGNCVMFSRASLPLSALLAPISPPSPPSPPSPAFRAVARAVRRAVQHYRRPSTLRAATAWISACPRAGVGCVDMNVDVALGLDVVATSWRVLRAYERADFGFGGLRALRWASAVFDGYCFFYPTRKDGGEGGDEGVEVYLGLERGCMERLRADGELAAWAEGRGG